ncbi:unnamed protein product [Lathyrus sativus]|nr:unnamed protein product [Lathyrus sativus]
MVRRVTNLGVIHGFKVNDNVSYNLLQFADDAILVCDESWSNLWAVKSILMGFEMVSGLKINTWESYLYGVGIEDHFLNDVAHFLACKKDSLPFKNLGLIVEATIEGCHFESWLSRVLRQDSHHGMVELCS